MRLNCNLLNMDWIELKIDLSPFHLELLSSYLFATGAAGIEEGTDHFKVFYDSKDWDYEKELLLKQYIKSVIPEFSPDMSVISKIENEDWNIKWKENFKPFRIGEKIVIAPDWVERSPADNELWLTISPKMAFGTGHHETTQLILLAMEKFLSAGMSLLDAGTGSGILAIYAAMCGAGPVIAFDNDPVAVENTAENCRLNAVENKIRYFCGELSDLSVKKFDMIAANINKNALSSLAGQFRPFLKEKGILILSGLLKNDERQMLKIYEENSWQFVEKIQKNEWISLIFRLKQTGEIN